MRCGLNIAIGIVGLLLASNLASAAKPASGPLRVHPANPRYFADATGRAILLTGSHTWNNLVDMGPTDPPRSFDYDEYLDWLVTHHHNFFRLWTWELVSWDTRGNRQDKPRVNFVAPHPWKRTGPGSALDGRPKFDLEQYDNAYFARLRNRVEKASNQGVYLAVMLFEGWGIQFSPGAWESHPFHPGNNVQNVDGDLDGDGNGLEIHSGDSRTITEIQQAYVRRVIDTVNEFDNVLYEISNENHPPSTQWQYDMIRYIKRYEAGKPKQHPVGMTFQYKGGDNQTLWNSPADWVSPNSQGGYRDDPPATDGSKVVVTDTDHLWGIGGNAAWVWKSFLRGMNPIFMDPYKGTVLTKGFDESHCQPIREALGHVLKWSRRVDLAGLTPHGDLCSSKYCLANPNVEYLAFVPAGQSECRIKLQPGNYSSIWFDTLNGNETQPELFQHTGGERTAKRKLEADALWYIQVSR